MLLEGRFQSCIEIYLRLAPVAGKEIAEAEFELDDEDKAVQWLVPRQPVAGMTNHQREKFNFSFSGILGCAVKQDVVFDTVAKKVVMGALDGYNGTIFAYGQTGSGKTYTITGSAERYVDRGIIPRALSLIFSDIAKRTDYTYQLHFAYLEIYNEIGYDLLNPDHETKALEDLPKVTMLEDGENCFHLRNLSQHLATNEEEALNLLFVGETNRMISATPMNLASSRSHCIFTVTVEGRKAGEDTVRKSKLHLVDLAGSERVWKNGIDGQILKEAKYINLSLHFLEQVIIALQERSQGKSRQHIPYRNSMMTSLLRDSIGGNSLTVMVATVTVAQQQLEETISTCRFAQRVALVSNQVIINEEIDQNLVIKRLKQEIRDLKEELQLLRGGQERAPLTDIELSNLRTQINSYVADTLSEAPLNCGGTMMQIRAAFRILKEMLTKPEDNGLNLKNADIDVKPICVPPSVMHPMTSTSGQEQETMSKLIHQLQERENEINILVSFIRKREMNMSTTSVSTQAPDFVYEVSVPFRQVTIALGEQLLEPQESVHSKLVQDCSKDFSLANWAKSCDGQPSAAMTCPADRVEAFEIFRCSYPPWDAIEENKAILKEKYAKAKFLGEQVNKAHGVINDLKADIEKCRVDRAIQKLTYGVDSSERGSDSHEQQLLSIMVQEKSVYKENFSKLRDLKNEIEVLHRMLEQSRTRLQVDFEKWVEKSATMAYEATFSKAEFEKWMKLLGPQQSSVLASQSSRPSSPTKRLFPPVTSPRAVSSVFAGGQRSNDFHAVSSSLRDKIKSPTQRPLLAPKPSLESGLLTGDENVDADVMAFYRARADFLSAQL